MSRAAHAGGVRRPAAGRPGRASGADAREDAGDRTPPAPPGAPARRPRSWRDPRGRWASPNQRPRAGVEADHQFASSGDPRSARRTASRSASAGSRVVRRRPQVEVGVAGPQVAPVQQRAASAPSAPAGSGAGSATGSAAHRRPAPAGAAAPPPRGGPGGAGPGCEIIPQPQPRLVVGSRAPGRPGGEQVGDGQRDGQSRPTDRSSGPPRRAWAARRRGRPGGALL